MIDFPDSSVIKTAAGQVVTTL